MHYNYKNLKINYEIIGSGKPVLILHGLACSMEQMNGCLENIFNQKQRYKRIYIDLVGMGKSESDMDMASSNKILDMIVSFVDDIVSENFLLIGASYGGYLSRGLLAKLSERIDAVMLLCPVMEPVHSKRKIPKKNFIFKNEEFWEKLSEEERKNFEHYGVILNEKVYERYKKEVDSGLKLANTKFINELLKDYKFSDDLEMKIKELNYVKPSLIICGRQDICVGYKEHLDLIENFERSTFAILDMAGHNLQIEQSEIFETLVKDWIDRVNIDMI